MNICRFDDSCVNLKVYNKRSEKYMSEENFNMEKNGDLHLQLYASSDAPKRDYHGLTITNTEVILNSWDISHGPHVYPRRKRINLKEFKSDKWMRVEIENLFGTYVIKYIDRITNGDTSIYNLSEKIMRKIIGYLALQDILHLKQSSKIFFDICNNNAVWKILFRKNQKRAPNEIELKQAELGLTWEYILRTRIQDKGERKKIYKTYKNGVDALIRQTSEHAKNIRKIVKNVQQFKDEPRNPEKDKLYANKIKIPTYKVGDVKPTTPKDKKTESITPIKKVESKIKTNEKIAKNTQIKNSPKNKTLINKTLKNMENNKSKSLM